jgi:2-aminoethylphosphonate-pyruvate transaminase
MSATLPAPRAAVILAAGMGTRLRSVFSDLPKGFVEIGGEPLIERSLRILQERGIERTVIVAGHLGDAYRDLAARSKGVEVVDNLAFADTGSMASLARALQVVDEDFLLLESDLFYEERAVEALLDSGSPDVLLASGPTGATDEVWVEAVDGRLSRLSKEPGELDSVHGELVGLLRVSRDLGRLLAESFRRFEAREGHGRMAYETDALVEVSAARPVDVCLIPDLLWGEVDYEAHYLRVRDEVFPAWQARQQAASGAGAKRPS